MGSKLNYILHFYIITKPRWKASGMAYAKHVKKMFFSCKYK